MLEMEVNLNFRQLFFWICITNVVRKHELPAAHKTIILIEKMNDMCSHYFVFD